jgi:hypothetical protein
MPAKLSSTVGEGSSEAPDASDRRTPIARITRAEIVVAVMAAAVLLVLVILEPDILEAPFQNERTLLFTFGGTALAAIAFAVMLRYRVPPIVRIVVLLVPFVIVSWWLISPYFVDDVVDEDFTTSIAEQAPLPATDVSTPTPGAAATTPPPADQPTATTTPVTAPSAERDAPAVTTPAPPPDGPVLLGAGQFVGLAGHSGTGDAGLFRNPDGSLVLRFENFDIENGPDLEVYLVPGADQVSLPDGSIPLGALKGNIGDQNYDLPTGLQLAPGAYTALVWCEAFGVEFVGATLAVG